MQASRLTGAELRELFGGRWDGGGAEIHGLLDYDGRQLKIELLRGARWYCSVFEGGRCVASSTKAEADAAVRAALVALKT